MGHGQSCTCGCGGQLLLADDRTTDEERQRLALAFEQMMRALYKQNGSQLQIDLVADKKVQAFINTHADILNSTLPTQNLTPRMRERLERSNYILSGMKAFHELHEAFPSLLDEHGARKPFNQFLQEVQAIDSTYNKNYLRAEYNFVQQSAEMARKWEQFAQDGDRYYLQYRTANDDRVRPEHEEMDRITLPMDDPFWEEFYPPNGWNCRCNVVQVRKSKYDPTPPTEAIERAAGATGRDVRGIFKFNAGREESTVPAHNPYTIRRCNTCPIAHNKRKGRIELAKFVPSNEACAACKVLQECYLKRMNPDEVMGERLKICVNADKKDLLGNLRTARVILKNYPKVEVEINNHVMEHGVKNPEYTFVEKGMRKTADRKGIESINGVTAAFRKAVKQGCQIVVLDLDEHMKAMALHSHKLSSKLFGRHKDFLEGIITDCYIVYRGQAIRITDKQFRDNNGDVLNKQQVLQKLITKIDKIREQ